jgi:hypothetical protein
MNGLRVDRWALALCSALLLLNGCGAAPAAPSLGTAPFSRVAHPDHGSSWMKPGAAKIKELLYVSDLATDDVYVYDYASGAAVGKLRQASYGDASRPRDRLRHAPEHLENFGR